MKKIIIFPIIILIFLYSNCGGYRLQNLSETSIPPVFAKASGTLCIKEGYTLESFYVRNVNTQWIEGQLFADSDGDGLADVTETENNFNPQKRRTTGQLLDRICFNSGQNGECGDADLACSSDENQFGLSQCDYQFLNLDQIYSHTDQGIDSDKDGIPDFIEILSDSFANLKDAFDDPDRDQIPNQSEISQGFPVRTHNNRVNLDFATTIEVNKQETSTGNCGHEFWTYDLKQVPLVYTKSYSASSAGDATNGMNLDHDSGENVIIFTYKIRPIGNTGESAEVWYATQTVFYDQDQVVTELTTQGMNFIMAGEVEP